MPFCPSVLLLFCSLSQLPFPIVSQPSRTSTSAFLPTSPFGSCLGAFQTLPLDLTTACTTDSVLPLPAAHLLPLIDHATKSVIKVYCLDLRIGSVRKPDSLVFNQPKKTPRHPLLTSLHWLRVMVCIKFKTLVLAFQADSPSLPPKDHQTLHT